MTKMKKIPCAILLIMLLSGCATSFVRFNPEKEKEMRNDFIGIYPATILDGMAVAAPFVPIFVKFEGTDASEGKAMCYFFGPFLLVGGLIDMPISIVSDTLMIPFDLYNSNPKTSKDKDTSRPVPPEKEPGNHDQVPPRRN